MIFFHDVPLSCINQAAIQYQIPATLIVSVIKIENGRNGQVVKNKNGTVDLGVMQINSQWIAQLQKKSITQDDIQSNPCINVQVGTWILAQGIARSDGWRGVGNYHSSTDHYNAVYREQIRKTHNNLIFTLKREA